MVSIRWSPHPSTIGRELVRRVAAIEPACKELAASHAKRGESAMKANAPWNDRSTHARQRLFGVAEGTTIILGHTMEYGVFLEDGTHFEDGTTKMAPRPIIGPTQQQVAPEYFADAAKVVKGILG